MSILCRCGIHKYGDAHSIKTISCFDFSIFSSIEEEGTKTCERCERNITVRRNGIASMFGGGKPPRWYKV